MKIRLATSEDLDAVWAIFNAVVRTGDTYVFDPATPKEDLKTLWFAPTMNTFVAEDQGKIEGTYFIKPNQLGLGAHIGNCGYMVHPDAHHKGIGKAMCAHSITTGKTMGFRGIQFNFVVSTNTAAVSLWKKFGFEIIGTIPKGFNHQRLGYVDAYIMFKTL